jgi:hypothetical protein
MSIFKHDAPKMRRRIKIPRFAVDGAFGKVYSKMSMSTLREMIVHHDDDLDVVQFINNNIIRVDNNIPFGTVVGEEESGFQRVTWCIFDPHEMINEK